MKDVKSVYKYIFLHIDIQLSLHHLLGGKKAVFSLLDCYCSFIKKKSLNYIYVSPFLGYSIDLFFLFLPITTLS